jgi:hypothetical protein
MSHEFFTQGKLPSRKDVESFIYRWNVNYPIDRWWREKHKVAFNSPEHRVVSFYDMYVEWLEDKLYADSLTKEIKNSQYKPGDWLQENKSEKSLEESIKEAESFDFSKLDDKK